MYLTEDRRNDIRMKLERYCGGSSGTCIRCHGVEQRETEPGFPEPYVGFQGAGCMSLRTGLKALTYLFFSSYYPILWSPKKRFLPQF